MKTLFQAALELQGFLQGKGWRFCFIGGLALQRWGEPRLTVDVDVSLLTGFGGEEGFIRPLLAAYPPRIPDAAGFALENRVLLLRSDDGVGFDVALAGLPFEEAVVGRSSAFEFLPGVGLVTCSAEDLIVLKAFAARPRDWADVDGILTRQRGKLDKRLVLDCLAPLCEVKGAPEILSRVKDLLDRA
ncbi:MAG: nucleotidyl transferase AbiEii/AbiGii toxin family protein [Elusimicrobia bacterium]|nr:nucleotidyl transferase AbiEii/AbiGii toxin family protein [Elusimicrobiota bacterium]